MIRMANSDGDIIFVLEPGNITNMMTGKPVVVDMSQFGRHGQLFIYWTPDLQRLAIEMAQTKEADHGVITGEKFDKIIKKALEWRVHDRVVS